MLLSKYLLPTLKEKPSEASIISHQLMLRSGMVRQLTSGIYYWLPYGHAVLKKIENIVREELIDAGLLEVLIPTMQPVDLWQRSGRYGTDDDLGTEMLQAIDRNKNILVYTPTAEEAITHLFAQNISSYKSLPKTLFQIGWKFRDEIRPRFGLMRAREFLMKDAYSFDLDEASALVSYNVVLKAYLKIFKRLGLKVIPVEAPTGAMGGSLSHELHILTKNGESQIFYDEVLENFTPQTNDLLSEIKQYYAKEKEMHDPSFKQNNIKSSTSIEIAHLFYLGDKYTKSLNVKIQNASGSTFNPEMGCYGIGISRMIPAIIESSYDENGIIFNDNLAPFKYIILNLKPSNSECSLYCENIYQQLKIKQIDVMLDDTEASIGEKFTRAELIGIPNIIAIGDKVVKENKIELKSRSEKTTVILGVDEFLNQIK